MSENRASKRKKRSKTNWRSILLVGALLLVMISFILTSIPNFGAKPNKRSATGKNSPAVTHKPASNPSIQFKEEGTLDIIRKGNPELVSLDIEVADNESDRRQGLMYRRSMKQNQGMFFIMDAQKVQSFFMKNTYIPLDIIYIDEQRKIVSIQKNAQPLDETSLPSEAPAKYVLEVNAGFTDTYGIAAGDRIKFHVFQN